MLSDFFNISATVIQWTTTLNEVGINVLASTYTSVANINIALQQLSKNESYIDGTDRIIGTHRAFTAVNTTIQEEHHILIGSDEYDIKGIHNPMQMNRHYEILLELVE